MIKLFSPYIELSYMFTFVIIFKYKQLVELIVHSRL